LIIKNSKMQTKAEEEAANASAREQDALNDRVNGNGNGNGVSDEKAAIGSAQAERDAAGAEREEMEAVAIASSGEAPSQVTRGGVDAQVILAEKEGRSAV
jgi:hypothetical protein